MTSIVCDNSCTSRSFSLAALKLVGDNADGFEEVRLQLLAPLRDSYKLKAGFFNISSK
jgi:hypothetical protein